MSNFIKISPLIWYVELYTADRQTSFQKPVLSRAQNEHFNEKLDFEFFFYPHYIIILTLYSSEEVKDGRKQENKLRNRILRVDEFSSL